MKELINNVESKIIDNYEGITSDNILHINIGGSHLHGTNDETSDYDIRTIVFLNIEYQLGLKEFQHKKIIDGKQKINQKDDLDIEIFHLKHFIQRAYHGDMIPIEMLYSANLKDNSLIEPLINIRETFLSKMFATKYYNYIRKNMHLAFLDVEKSIQKSSRPDKIERLKEFGYETKFAMKAYLGLTILNELLEEGKYQLDRREIDSNKLIEIKEGKCSRKEMFQLIEELDFKQKELFEKTELRTIPNFDVVNNFLINYQKSLFTKFHIDI